MGSLKVILTDLDGVIRHWNSASLNKAEVELNLPKGYVFSICFEKELLLQVITGQISDSEWRKIVQAKLSRLLGESLAKGLVDSWTNSEVFIDKTIIESYKKHFPKAKVILATNATTRLHQDLRNQGLNNMFDGILNSSELGCAKPSRRFFNQALDKLGIGVDEVIYIDDSIKNVQSARQLGIRSHHYQDHTQLVEFLLDAKKIYFSNSDI